MYSTKMLVYPNPAKEKVYLGNATIGSQYNIYTNTRQRIKSGRINNILEEIDISDLPKGIYYIDIIEAIGGGRKRKFVKE